jgi:hypothetical protein
MKEKRQWWIFTFLDRKSDEEKPVKVYGTYEEARKEVFKKYGNKYVFVYTEEEWNEINKNPLCWPVPELEILN